MAYTRPRPAAQHRDSTMRADPRLAPRFAGEWRAMMQQPQGHAAPIAPTRDYLAQVERNWERFIADQPVEDAAIRPVVLQSWRRSRALGVDPFRAGALPVATPDHMRHLRVRNELFLEALLGRIPQLWHELDRRRCAIAAADADGVLLTIDGNRDYVAHLSQDFSAPGFGWDERNSGTNAIGTALALGRGVQIHAHEHFCQADKRLTCMAQIVRDPHDRRVLGVIDLTSDDAGSADAMRDLLRRIIGEVGDDISASVTAELARVRDAYAAAQRGGEGLVAFDRYGRVVAFQGVGRGGPDLAAGRSLDGFDAECVRGRFLPEYGGGEADQWLRGADVEWFRDGSGGLIHFARPPAIRPVRAPVELAPSLAAVATASPSLTPLLQRAQLYARRRMPILLLGETGNGKDVTARAIHAATTGRDAPFIAVNCAALPRDLAASELFGHAEGAFTGARRGGARGKFEEADGGTIFLDEIGDMPLELQPYLLRVLEDRIVCRLGESRERPVALQVIAATNRSLAADRDAGRFRADLWFRLAGGTIELPSLRHRLADLAPLIDALLDQILLPGEARPALEPGLIAALAAHDWPGNLRELRNVLEGLVAMSPDGVLALADLPDGLVPRGTAGGGQLGRIERDAIIAALERSNGDVPQAARELGISRATIYRRLRKYRQ
ncbi:sigma-54-dependent Fis family transcriptional regulator [Novosphingobium colocasiae]|uniref:sigma-54-dependent Fis family transcriptional regulator n=1 Tax=Novosphingobium colocasiae TaxID=1256513 RepID=UPI0035B0044A